MTVCTLGRAHVAKGHFTSDERIKFYKSHELDYFVGISSGKLD